MIVKLLTEHHLEFLSLKRGCRGSSKSTLVKLLEISCRGSIKNFHAVPNLLQLIRSITQNIHVKYNSSRWK